MLCPKNNAVHYANPTAAIFEVSELFYQKQSVKEISAIYKVRYVLYVFPIYVVFVFVVGFMKKTKCVEFQFHFNSKY